MEIACEDDPDCDFDLNILQNPQAATQNLVTFETILPCLLRICPL